jgi:hypothetical protein
VIKVTTTLTVVVTIVSILPLFFPINQSHAVEMYQGVLRPSDACTFSYADQIEGRDVSECYPQIGGVLSTYEENLPTSDKEELVFSPVIPSISMQEPDFTRFWISRVSSSSIPYERYDNVGEPTFSSNGTHVLYAGNHFAARSVVGQDWEYVDPYFDFRGEEQRNFTNSNFSRQVVPIFKADQHIEYDPVRDMYLWIRQGEQVIIGGERANIDRLSLSRDLEHWVAYDLISTDVLGETGIIRAVFDYPDIVLTDRYFYLTTSVYSDNPTFGLILRISLDDLSNSLDQPANNLPAINYEFVLDRNIETITPVNGASNPMYFGSHLPNNSNMMKIYTWFDDSPTLNSVEVSIAPWNNLKNRMICSSYPEAWWCQATSSTSSRIRSAWMLDNSINFLWNAITTHDNGMSWVPYSDSATFYIDEGMRYERKYHLAHQNIPFVFGSVSPNNQGNLGVGIFYIDTSIADSLTIPYLSFAFGVYNDIERKWEMMPVLTSSAPLPVRNEEGYNDYNFGDFLTTRAHTGDDGLYSWDTGAYVIVGSNSYDIEPYYVMVKN